MKTAETEYKITFDHCKTLINGVCDGCGGELSPIETVDNSDNPTFWAHCPKCSKFHWGTPKEVFNIAVKMVDESHFRAYRHMQESDYHYRESQISGACHVVRDVMRYASLVSEEKDRRIIELTEVLTKVQKDVNWMTNEGKLLNRFVFDYIDKALNPPTDGSK